MPLQLTIQNLLDRSRRRADKVGDDGLTDPFLQQLLAEVYNTLYTSVGETGHRYFEASQAIATTGAVSYTMPTDHLGTVRVERVLDTAGRSMPLREISAQEQTYWRGLTGPAYRYAVADDQLFLLPTPPSGDNYVIYYIPQAPDISTLLGSCLIDLVVPAGERYLINGTAALAKAQTDGNVEFLISERDQALVDLIEWSSLRAFTQAPSPFVEDYDVSGLLPNSYDYGAGWWNRPK